MKLAIQDFIKEVVKTEGRKDELQSYIEQYGQAGLIIDYKNSNHTIKVPEDAIKLYLTYAFYEGRLNNNILHYITNYDYNIDYNDFAHLFIKYHIITKLDLFEPFRFNYNDITHEVRLSRIFELSDYISQGKMEGFYTAHKEELMAWAKRNPPEVAKICIELSNNPNTAYIAKEIFGALDEIELAKVNTNIYAYKSKHVGKNFVDVILDSKNNDQMLDIMCQSKEKLTLAFYNVDSNYKYTYKRIPEKFKDKFGFNKLAKNSPESQKALPNTTKAAVMSYAIASGEKMDDVKKALTTNVGVKKLVRKCLAKQYSSKLYKDMEKRSINMSKEDIKEIKRKQQLELKDLLTDDVKFDKFYQTHFVERLPFLMKCATKNLKGDSEIFRAKVAEKILYEIYELNDKNQARRLNVKSQRSSQIDLRPLFAALIEFTIGIHIFPVIPLFLLSNREQRIFDLVQANDPSVIQYQNIVTADTVKFFKDAIIGTEIAIITFVLVSVGIGLLAAMYHAQDAPPGRAEKMIIEGAMEELGIKSKNKSAEMG